MFICMIYNMNGMKNKLHKKDFPSKTLMTLIDRNDGSQRELEYGTEADVAGFVSDALFDAIGIVKYF